MDHELEAAIPELAARGVIPAEQAPILLRAASRERVSLRTDLRLLLYLGVLLVTSGVGLRLAAAAESLTTLAVAGGIAAATIACFVWVRQRAEPFSWGESSPGHLAFDYILLLGALLVASLLAWLEARLNLVGGYGPHLLLIAALYLGLAFRYDSRLLFGLALSSAAAWRGVSIATIARIDPLFGSARQGAVLRENAAIVGILFVALGALLRRTQRKPHFEPVASELGAILALGALAFGMDPHDPSHWWYATSALVAGSLLALWARNNRRPRLVAIGIAAAYAGASGIVLRVLDVAILAAAWFAFSATVLVVLLLRARPPREEAS